jgi:hypothetical protein
MKLKDIFWDYTFTEEELNDLLHGNVETVGTLTRSALLVRMFEYMNWFDITQKIDRHSFLTHITPEFIETLQEHDLQQGLTFVRNFLLTQTLSTAR